MIRLTYVGPHDEVAVPSAGVVCKNGESVEVPDDLGKSLLAQADNWQPVKTAAAKKEH
jgi:hypothetical protein